jgi:hypothetical protein
MSTINIHLFIYFYLNGRSTTDEFDVVRCPVGENTVKAGSLKMNTALEYSTRVVQEH